MNITSDERLSSVGSKRFMSVKPFKSLIREKLRDEGPDTKPLDKSAAYVHYLVLLVYH